MKCWDVCTAQIALEIVLAPIHMRSVHFHPLVVRGAGGTESGLSVDHDTVGVVIVVVERIFPRSEFIVVDREFG